jgi:hypothetical protein
MSRCRAVVSRSLEVTDNASLDDAGLIHLPILQARTRRQEYPVQYAFCNQHRADNTYHKWATALTSLRRQKFLRAIS